MSIFSAIASDLSNVFSDPGKLVSDLVDAVLPDKLRSVGDVAGGFVDAVLGKEGEALSHFQAGLRDLPGLLGGSSDLAPTNQTIPTVTAALPRLPTALAQTLRA